MLVLPSQTLKGRATALVALVILAATAAVAAAAQADPLVGTWTLNLTKSTYSSGPAPRSEIVTYEAAGQGVSFLVERVDAAGEAITLRGTLMYDGKDHPFPGTPDWDAETTRRIDALTTETTRKKAGKAVGVRTRVVSADGKTLTLTTRSTDAQGRAIKEVQVYDRK